MRNIYYEIIGEGFPLVFLHGNQEDANVFSNQIEALKDKYQLILIDTIMHGKSKNSFRKYNFYDLALDVLNILQKEKITKANFIGFSDGANILFHLALLYEEIINKAISISGNICYTGLKKVLRQEIALETKKYLKEKNDKYYYYYLMNKQPQLKFKQLNNINSKFLIVARSNDLIYEKHTKKISKHLKNATLKIVKDFTHFSLIEKPLEMNKIIIDYLEKCDQLGDEKQ